MKAIVELKNGEKEELEVFRADCIKEYELGAMLRIDYVKNDTVISHVDFKTKNVKSIELKEF